MNPEIEKLIQERIEKIPPKAAEVIKNMDWVDEMKKIASENALSDEEVASFEIETIMVILGIEPLSNYPENLSQKTKLDEEKVVVIAKAVNDRIINSILEPVEKPQKKIGEASKEPVIITPQTKKDVIEQLSQRVAAAKQSGASVKPPKSPAEIPNPKHQITMEAEIYPMVKPGEVVHEVPQEETPNPKSQNLNKPEIQGEVNTQTAQPFDKAQGKPAEPSVPPPQTPTPTPTEPPLKNPEPTPTREKDPSRPANPHYPGGLDPYREPLA